MSTMRMTAAAATAILAAGALQACTALGALDALTPVGNARLALLDQPYGVQARQRADVYIPTPRSTAAAPPVAVFFYGGNWRMGNKRDYRFVAEALAERGVLVVVPDYRLYPGADYVDILQDSAQAVAWALKQTVSWGGDPNRVFLIGHSAGAYNAAMVALNPELLAGFGASTQQLAGWVGLAGPYNFLPIENADTRPVFHWPDTPAASQPIRHVGDGPPPRRTLLIAPRQDTVVDPERNTEALAVALRRIGADVVVYRHASLSHATTVGAFAWPLRTLAPVLAEVGDFLLNDTGVYRPAIAAAGAQAAQGH